MTNTCRSSNIVKVNDEIIGREVKNNADEHLGKVKELVLDKITGTVQYIVLDTGGFMGIGNKYLALPWSIFHFDDDKNCFCVNISKEKLENAPGFDKDHWPDMADPTFAATVARYYQKNP